MAFKLKKADLAVGLFVDGLDVKFACLERAANRIRLKEYSTVSLANKFEETDYADFNLDEILISSEGTAFDLEGQAGTTLETGEKTDTNQTVIQQLLKPYAGKKFAITYAITEPVLEYNVLDTSFELEGKKLQRRIVEELGKIRSVSPDPENLHFFQTGTGALVTIIREDGIQLATLINEVKKEIGQRVPNISLIEAAEVALMNAVRLNYSFASDESTLLVYVGKEFTRLIFMLGQEYQHFAPVIPEGIEAIDIQNTIYSRAILEQDNLAIGSLDRIILAGDAHRLELQEFFRSSVPDVSYMQFDRLDVTKFPAEAADDLSEYAIPIATAWKALEPKNPAFYPTNLLPSHLAREQQVFRLTWHGVLLLLLVFVGTVFFSVQIPTRQRTIDTLVEEVAFKQLQLFELEQVEASIAGLNNDIGQRESALQVYEELAPAYDRWSKAFAYLTTGVENITSLWIVDVSSKGDRGLEINGYSLFRANISRFASLFENAVLQQVAVGEIRGRTVYRFTLFVENAGAEVSQRSADSRAGWR